MGTTTALSRYLLASRQLTRHKAAPVVIRLIAAAIIHDVDPEMAPIIFILIIYIFCLAGVIQIR